MKTTILSVNSDDKIGRSVGVPAAHSGQQMVVFFTN